jgi:hypothetical protein
VVYDGFNDLAWQMNLELSAEPTNVYDRARNRTTNAGAGGPDATTTSNTPSSSGSSTTFTDVVDAYWDQSASGHVYDALHDLFAGSDEPNVEFAEGVAQTVPAQTPEQISEAVRNAISIQARAATIAIALAESVGAEVAFFWQPTVFTKKLLPDEEKYLSLDSYEPARWDPAIKEARELLKTTPFVDVGDSLDRATTPVFWDFVHTNEEGARLSAASLYSHLSGQLATRAERAGANR